MSDLFETDTSGGGAPLSPPRKMRRDPVPIAIAVIVVLAVSCLGLAWWGPMNPSVAATASVPTARPGTDEVDLVVVVNNQAMAAVDVTAVDVINVNGAVPPELRDPQVLTVESAALRSGAGPPATTEGLPVSIAGRTGSQLRVRLLLPRCPGMGSNGTIGGVRVELTIRSAWGMTKVQQADVSPSNAALCLPAPSSDAPLPTGPGPTDAAAAEAAVRHAYSIVYDQASPPDARGALVDDPSGLAEPTAAALAGPSGAYAAGATAAIHQISFDRPDHAWLTYELTGTGLATRLGEAVLIDGVWKVSRATVCADLALAGAVCPPVPK
ncbi:MAG TPA: hypothetical protein VIJ47_04805 [Acidimicrobiales bacterium]